MRLDIVDGTTGTDFALLAETDSDASKLTRLIDATRSSPRLYIRQAEPHIIILAPDSVLRRTAELLKAAAGREITVSDLADQLAIPKGRVSTALTALKDSGLVERWHRARWRWKGGC